MSYGLNIDRRRPIGHYGCSHNGGRVVSVGIEIERRKRLPVAVELDCPVCGETHLVQPMWRQANDGEVAEVAV